LKIGLQKKEDENGKTGKRENEKTRKSAIVNPSQAMSPSSEAKGQDQSSIDQRYHFATLSAGSIDPLL